MEPDQLEDSAVDAMPIPGKRLTLVPLSLEHVAGLAASIIDGNLWQTDLTEIPAPHALVEYVTRAISQRSKGRCLPYVMTLGSPQKIIGSLRIFRIDPRHRHAEIGHIWISKSFQRQGLNVEANSLLLQHAFVVKKYLRIQYCTDELNDASRKSIIRLGAIEEGVLRHERIAPSGRLRNTVVYSIIAPEWTSQTSPT
jgi:N-acetyltransferase